MSNAVTVGIVIPARNEASLVRRCLQSVLRAARHSGAACFVVLVDDGSTDGTAALARRLLAGGSGRVLPGRSENVGAARADGIDLLLARSPDLTWIANTDADTVVPRDWISRQLRHAERGAHAVAGLVDVDREAHHALRQVFSADYREKVAGGSHSHIHGANLGFSTHAYRAVGGFSALTCGEDVDLWQRVEASGLTVVSDPDLVVRTSARLVSRTNGGFATHLRRLAAGL